MTNADFSEANLKEADLCLTNLENASFSRAKLGGQNWSGQNAIKPA
jgi:uncharacterized protein YjbI with pentapeptide repeats